MARVINGLRIVDAKLINQDIDKLGKSWAIDYDADGFAMVNVTVQDAPQDIKTYLEGDNSITVYPVASNIDKLCDYALASFPNIEEIYLFKTSNIVVLDDDLSYLTNLTKIYVPSDLLSAYQSAYPTIASKFDVIVSDYTLNVPYVGQSTLTAEYMNTIIGMLSAGQRSAITKVVIPTDFTQDSAVNIYFNYNFNALPNLNGNIWWGTIEHCVDSTLNNNSPSIIRQVIRNGKTLDFWYLGDEINITLSNNTQITMRLIDAKIGRYNIKDSNDKSNAVFMATKIYWNGNMNSPATNNGGWSASYMCTSKMPELFNLFPNEWKEVMSEVSIFSATSGNDSTLTSAYNKLFIPNTYEIFGVGTYTYSTEQTDQFGWYVGKSDADRIIKDTNNNASLWSLRSPLVGSTNKFVYVRNIGDAGSLYDAYQDRGIAVCFAI